MREIVSDERAARIHKWAREHYFGLSVWFEIDEIIRDRESRKKENARLKTENARLKALLKKLINTLERFKNPSSVAWVRKTASVAVDLIRDPRHGGGE